MHHVSEQYLPRYLAELDFRRTHRKLTDREGVFGVTNGAEGKPRCLRRQRHEDYHLGDFRLLAVVELSLPPSAQKVVTAHLEIPASQPIECLSALFRAHLAYATVVSGH